MDIKDEKRMSLRISPDLHQKIVAAAHERNLSINAFMIQALESAVDPDNLAARLATLEEKVRYLTDGP